MHCPRLRRFLAESAPSCFLSHLLTATSVVSPADSRAWCSLRLPPERPAVLPVKSHNPESAQLMYFIPAPGPHQSCPQGTAVTLSPEPEQAGSGLQEKRRHPAAHGLDPTPPRGGPRLVLTTYTACKEMSARLCYQLRQTSVSRMTPRRRTWRRCASPAHRKLLQYPSCLLTTGQPPPSLPALQPHCLPTNPAEEGKGHPQRPHWKSPPDGGTEQLAKPTFRSQTPGARPLGPLPCPAALGPTLLQFGS